MLDRVGSSIRNALLMCAGGMLIGGVCVALSFGIAAKLWQFVPLFALGEFAWFATQARSLCVTRASDDGIPLEFTVERQAFRAWA